MTSESQPKVTLPRPRRQGKRALAAWVWILAFSLAALIATYVMFVEPPPPHKIVIASGSHNGGILPICPAVRAGIAKRRPVR